MARVRQRLVAAVVFALLIHVCALAHGDQQAGQPSSPVTGPRDNVAPKDTGTARVSGRVVAAETGMPLRHALVMLMGEPLKQPRAANTDDQGRYEIRNLPAGRYSLTANKTGYLARAYGQTRDTQPGTLLELRDGESSARVDLRLPKTGAITGRITDEVGEPLANVSVRVVRVSYSGGKRRLGQIGSGSTDDRGQFRVFGLPAGDYYVSAVGEGMMEFASADGPSGYAPTYYPGTSSASDAQRIRVGPGAEQGPLNFALIPARGVRISGTVVTSTGAPAPMGMIMLQSGSPEDGTVDMRGGGMLQADGSFSLSNIAPGSYVLHANFGMGQDDESAESGSWPITVAGEDQEGLTLTTSRPTRLVGQLVFDGTAPRDAKPAEFALYAQPIDPSGMWYGGGKLTLKDDWTFEGLGSHGPLTIGVAAFRGEWTLKAVLVNGEDVTDTGIPLEGERVEGLQVVLTNRVTKVSGSVVDDLGKPARDCQVLVFPDDPAAWRRNSRRMGMSAVDQQGRFEVSSLPPGHYLAAASESVEDGDFADAELLEPLRASATAFELHEGESKTIAIRGVKR